MVKITEVLCGSIAEKAGIRSGDILAAINGNEINDVLDYRYYLSERTVKISLIRDCEKIEVIIKKGEYDDIGLEFETPLMDKKHSCKNGCIFCFIDQNPKGLRDSIYFKDDDSRLSFLHGNYITLTNMTDCDIARIVKMRFSPINISVHTTNPDLRVKMMKNKRSGEVLKYLTDLKEAGIAMCGQVVLCRGVNDGGELKRTLTDLSYLYPEMSSVAIVPAGLTEHREGLYPLSDFTEDEAREIISLVRTYGDMMKEKYGERVFYAADELYLKAKLPLPDSEYYEDYPQIENGVGMLRSFRDEFEEAFEDLYDMRDCLSEKRTVSVVTGAAAYPMLKELSERLMGAVDNLDIKVFGVENSFFGKSITVAGLLTGADIVNSLLTGELGDELLIPTSSLSQSEDVFLCGMTLDELEKRLGVKVTPTECDGYEFVRYALGVE